MSLARTSVKLLCAASALLAAVVGVPLTRAAAAPPPPDACADILEGGWSAGLDSVISGASSTLLSDKVSYSYFDHVARLRVEMEFGQATCSNVTYEVTATSTDEKTVYRVASQQGDDTNKTLSFDVFIDRHTGYRDVTVDGEHKTCVIVKLRTFSGGKTYDVANDPDPNEPGNGQHRACKGGGGGTHYGG